MNLSPILKKSLSAIAGMSIVATGLFVSVGPACSCVSFEDDMAFRLGFPLSNGAEHSAEIARRELPAGASLTDVRTFIARVEPYDRDEVARHENGDWPIDVAFESRRKDARRHFDRLCQETPSQVACRFDTERFLFGTSGFDLVVSLNAAQRVERVTVVLHKWWQGAPPPLGVAG
jgi:hypothetical protein